MASTIKADTLQSTTSNVFVLNSAGTEYARFDADGDLGIGTASPDSKLHILNSVGASLRVGYLGGNTNYYDATTHTFRSANGSPSSFISNQYGIGLASTVPSSGVGIAFPATQTASGDPNTLDDYEEGTYTPSVTGSTSGGPFTFGTQSGYYTKIGREVKVSMFMSHNSTVTFAGAYKISLPFTVADYAGGGFVTYVSGWSGQSPKQFQIEASTTYGYLRGESATEMLDLQQGYIGNNTSFMLTIIYKTT